MEYFYDDIYISHKVNGKWSKPESVSANINTKDQDEAAVGLSADGKQIFILKYSEETSGDIYSSTLGSAGWSKPEKLRGEVNTANWEGSASISKNGKVLYFDSEREGGLGGTDIYKAELQKDGSWGNVVNLGPVINTPYNDEAAFIHADSKTLFFSSDGHKTMGGFDIFKSTVDGKGNWSTPKNLGYPVNTVGNDKYYVVSKDGKRGYYHQNNPNGYGELDLYMVDYDKKAIEEVPVVVTPDLALSSKEEEETKSDKPWEREPVSAKVAPISISGTLKNSDGSFGATSKARIKLIGDGNKTIAQTTSDSEGKFSFKNLMGNLNYEIEVVMDQPRKSGSTLPRNVSSPAVQSKPRPQVEPSGAITIAKHVVCSSIDNRSPVGESSSFSSGTERIWFYTEVNLGAGLEESITHKWYFNGKELSSVQLKVKGPRWRTYSYQTYGAWMKGSWKVEVISSGGDVLGTKEFTVN